MEPNEQITLDQATEDHAADLLGGAAPEGVPAKQPEAEAGVSDAAAQSEETTGDVADRRHEDAEVSEGESSESEQDSQEDTEDRFVFTIDGENVEFTAASLQENLVRQKVLDERLREAKEQKYALADQATKMQQEMAETSQARQQYLQALENVQSKLGSLEDVPGPSEELRHSDPIRYQELKIAAIERREQIRQLEDRKQKVMQEQAVEQQRQLQEFQKKTKEQLLVNIPEWKDPKVFDRELRELNEFAASQGYTPERLQFFAAPDIVLLRDAKRYRDLMANQESVVANKVKQAAPTLKQGRALKSKPKDATQKAHDAFVKAAERGDMDTLEKAVDSLLAANAKA